MSEVITGDNGSGRLVDSNRTSSSRKDSPEPLTKPTGRCVTELPQKLSETYETLQVLQTTKDGNVFKCRNKETNGGFVIKFPKFPDDPLRGERFKREWALHVRCARAPGFESSNIIPLRAAGKIGNIPYLVMPFIDGGNLATALELQPLGVKSAIKMGIALCDAVEHLEKNNIVHRDIKPGNIMVQSPDKFLLLDFGLAAELVKTDSSSPNFSQGSLTLVGTRVGTVGYLPPEVLSSLSKPISYVSSDIFQIALSICLALDNRHPFLKEGEDLDTIGPRVTERPIQRLPRNYPENLKKILLQCFHFQPTERPQKPSDLKKELLLCL